MIGKGSREKSAVRENVNVQKTFPLERMIVIFNSLNFLITNWRCHVLFPNKWTMKSNTIGTNKIQLMYNYIRNDIELFSW